MRGGRGLSVLLKDLINMRTSAPWLQRALLGVAVAEGDLNCIRLFILETTVYLTSGG